MRGIYTSSTQVRQNQTQNILKHSNAKAPTFVFNVLYIMHDFPLFPYFSLTFSCSPFSISEKVYIFLFLIVYSSFSELYPNYLLFSSPLRPGPLPRCYAVLAWLAWNYVFLCTRDTLQGIGGPQVGDVALVAQANR